jgi:small subunit ribosomal protein S24e
VVIDEALGITGEGDAPTKKEALKVACISAEYQLHALNLVSCSLGPANLAFAEHSLQLEKPVKLVVPKEKKDAKVVLSNGEEIGFERARQFMDYYCRRFGFGRPDVTYEAERGGSPFHAIMTVGGRRIGIGTAPNKKSALVNSYLDVAQYLESCDTELWKAFVEASKTGKDAGLAPKVLLQMSEVLGGEIRDTCEDIRESQLFINHPKEDTTVDLAAAALSGRKGTYTSPGPEFFEAKNERLKALLEAYRQAPEHAEMRATREGLPVYTKIDELLKVVDENDVTICMAATGSGKTTQVPQLILDQWIDRGEGSKCNVICTQPRRIAAISVAQRVANERGETLGRSSIGYQVRFESRPPQDHGSVLFCTTGIFLNRMQNALEAATNGPRQFDEITHVIVDEVHERDVDIDLTLVVLKRLLIDRKARGVPIKIILMSATIDPSLFQTYFPTDSGGLAPVAEIPGRAFPVQKRYLNELLQEFGGAQALGPSGWVFGDRSVANYIAQEAGPATLAAIGFPASLALARAAREDSTGEDLDIPTPLVALTIAHVLNKSDDGHVLVFLPGWDSIQAVQKTLLNPGLPLLGVNFTDITQFSLHLLHSTVPIAEQQAIFEPAAPGVRRIILATNIAETSVTIPDVVYVVDTGKIKEQRYDPERHVSSLVSAWVGSSNLNQRAGRAGRHRPGEYYGLVSEARVEKLNPYQTVEIKRVDLSNVVMHVKALNFPGLEVEDVLAQTIEPPASDRVEAAIKNLKMVGALDDQKNVTALGKVLLQIPIDVQLGRLLLFGSFFKCLDPALTLAAIMSNRDAFNNPPLLKKEAKMARESWSPVDFRSDVLATLNAFNAWWEIQSRGQFQAANQFCSENFLSKPVLMQIQSLKGHLLASLQRAGVLDVSAGGRALTQRNFKEVPPELNVNAGSLPIMAGLVATGSQPNFAIRTSEKLLRTQTDRVSSFKSGGSSC